MDILAGLSPPAVLVATAVLGLALMIAAFRKVSAANRRAERAELAARKDRAQVAELEREVRDRVVTPTVGLSDALRVLEEMSGAIRLTMTGRSRRELGAAVGRAVERLLGAEQWMVFLDAERTGTDFILAASGSVDQKAWPVGACLTPQMGRVGLAIRRGKALNEDDFAAEPPLVRQQLETTEPSAFNVNIAAPIIVGEVVVGAIAVGGPRLSLDLASAIAHILSEGAAAGFRLLDAHDRSTRLENMDELTGLHNRNWFTANASELLFRNTDYEVPISAAVFGIDGFRDYARREGLSQAQRLLQAVAKMVQPMFREGDLLCRWTDTEFAVLMPGIDRATAKATLDRIRRKVGVEPWVGSEHQPGGALTVSVGLAVAPQDGIRFDPLIEAAYGAYQRSLDRGGDRTTGELDRQVAPASLCLGDTVDLPSLPNIGELAALREAAMREGPGIIDHD
jgi:diguanylate cyclase (GGDEF)-like protein